MSDRLLAANTRLQVILCASEDDKQAFHAAGFKSVRVVNASESLFVQTVDGFDLDPALKLFGLFVLAFPGAQSDLRDAIAVQVGDERCKWVDWPDDLPTAHETLLRSNPETLRSFVAAARPMWTDEVCLMSDVPDKGPQQSFVSGFRMLDDHGFRLVRPAFFPVIGPYGSGKSVLLRQLAANLYKLHGWRTLLTSFEEQIKPRYQRDLRRHFIDRHSSLWEPSDVDRADAEIEKAFRFLRRRRNGVMDIDRLLDRIRFAVKIYGVDVVIIDPVNELDHQVPHGESKTDYMGRFIMALKQLADDYNLLMIVAAHPPKDGVEKRSVKNKLLTLNDGADTAHYGNKADIGWCVWRPMMDGPTYLHIDKLKDTEVMGDPTLARLDLDKGLGKFNVTQIGYDIFAELES